MTFIIYWATPFEIHTSPVEDFGKVYHRGECKFSNAPTFCVIFKSGLSQSKYFIENLRVLSGKVGTGMHGPDRVPFRPLRLLFYWIGLDIGRGFFAKCLIFDEFVPWFTYRLSKSTSASQFT